MFQISVGRIAREYIVLSFNVMRPLSNVVDSKMFQWKQAGPICAHVCEEVGRTATTWFTAAAHGQHTWTDLGTLTFSLIAIRIGTGRRHQIRTHITHIGHPTVLDAKYADVSVIESEAQQLGRRLLQSQGLQVPAPPLQSRRFRSVYPQHLGVDPESLNPALLILAGVEPPPLALDGAMQPLGGLTTRAEGQALSLMAPPRRSSTGGPWSRNGPCSRAPRRVDLEGRDRDRCMVCGQFGHWTRECPNGGKDRCLVCGQIGHRAKECPEGGDTCLFCGKVGHQQKECPQLHPGADAWKPMCFDFKTEGYCRFGKTCPFSHLCISTHSEFR